MADTAGGGVAAAAAPAGVAPSSRASTGSSGRQINAFTLHEVLEERRITSLESYSQYILLGLSGELSSRAGLPGGAGQAGFASPSSFCSSAAAAPGNRCHNCRQALTSSVASALVVLSQAWHVVHMLPNPH